MSLSSYFQNHERLVMKKWKRRQSEPKAGWALIMHIGRTLKGKPRMKYICRRFIKTRLDQTMPISRGNFWNLLFFNLAVPHHQAEKSSLRELVGDNFLKKKQSHFLETSPASPTHILPRFFPSKKNISSNISTLPSSLWLWGRLLERLVINWEWGCYFCIWVVWDLVKQAIRYSIKYSIDPPNIVKFISPLLKTLPGQLGPCLSYSFGILQISHQEIAELFFSAIN